MTKRDDEIVAYTKSGTPIKAKYMRRLLDYREVDNIKQELAKVKRDAYTQGRVDEAKTCEGCKEDHLPDCGKEIAKAKQVAYAEVVEFLEEGVEVTDRGKPVAKAASIILKEAVRVLKSKFLTPPL